MALHTGTFPATVVIRLPRGDRPTFDLTDGKVAQDATGPYAVAGVVKDAGDDPDVTHGVTVLATARHGASLRERRSRGQARGASRRANGCA